jgi:AmmeMemoRadiSam system protein B
MTIRGAAVAGQFYPGIRQKCLVEVNQYLFARPIHAGPTELLKSPALPAKIVAGIVPHAGWVFSGDLAGMVFNAIKQANGDVDTFVIFGAAHRYHGAAPAVYDTGKWQSPLGLIDIDQPLAEAIIAGTIARSDPDGHLAEHSIEVQVPFIQYLFPEAKIVPIIVPAGAQAELLGTQVGRIITAQADRTDKRIVCIASTDLTHYGPGYGFAPAGAGQSGIAWAKGVNDREFIAAAVAMRPETLQKHALEHFSACGPGAAAAAVAAAKQLSCKTGILLGHTTSSEVLMEKFNELSTESVGYAAIVY